MDTTRIVEVIVIVSGVAASALAIIRALANPAEISEAWHLIVAAKDKQLQRRDKTIKALQAEIAELRSECESLDGRKE